MKRERRILSWVACLTLVCVLAAGSITALAVQNGTAVAENAAVVEAPAADPSPAIYVAQKNQDSVVGVITNVQTWNRSTGEVEETMYAQGSGVVIAEGGYILTNYHVIEDGETFKILMPSSEKVEATIVGSDSSVDLAVLRITDEEAQKQLVPVTVGASDNLIVGSTVVAIGNPRGELLANTVTQGIVSSLERSKVYSNNTTRNVAYIQHDAAINNGNSGGGLFNYKGELIGINTLKYSGNAYSSTNYDGLGFAIPVDTAYPVAMQLIEHGKVIRPQLGITVKTYEGPSEPMNNYPPASVCVYKINEGGPAEAAGMQLYDFIYSLNGQRVTSFREMTAVIDTMEVGDVVTVTVVRYNNVYPVTQNNSSAYDYFGNNFGFFPFGGFGNYGNYGNYSNGNGSGSNTDSENTPTQLTVGGGYEFITMDVVLEMPEDAE